MNNNLDLSDSIADRELIHRLKLATKDLFWSSEAEYPFHLVYWHKANNFTQNTLLQHYHYPPETEIAIKEFCSFFARATREESWHNQEEQAEVKRYQALVKLMADNLTNLKVYLLRKVEIDVCIIGETKSKAIAGITTKIIAT